MPTRQLITVVLASLSLAACFGRYEPAAEQAATGSTSAAPGETTGSTDGGETTAVASSTGGTTGGSEDDTTGAAMPCEHVDVLFVVDFSVSMGQFAGIAGALVPIANDFAAALEPLGSYHIGFTTNSGVPQNAGAYEPPAGTTGGSTGSTGSSSSTWSGTGDSMGASTGGSTGETTGGSTGGSEPGPCEAVGSLLRPLDEDCFEMLGGRPYVTKGDPLVGGVLCLLGGASVVDDALEAPRTVEAITLALGEANEPRGCNEGFHQPGDPLVVVAITDADDVGGESVPIAAATILANEGTLDAVALTIVAAPTCACTDAPRPCRGDDRCPAEPPCKLASVASALFGSDLETRTRETDLCLGLRGGGRPFQESLIAAAEEQIPLVCGAD